MLTCIIKYHIDPTKKSAFEHYARNWGRRSRAAAQI